MYHITTHTTIEVLTQKVTGVIVESKFNHINKKKVFSQFHDNTKIFLLGIQSHYETKGYLSEKQYFYLDRYYTLARERF